MKRDCHSFESGVLRMRLILKTDPYIYDLNSESLTVYIPDLAQKIPNKSELCHEARITSLRIIVWVCCLIKPLTQAL